MPSIAEQKRIASLLEAHVELLSKEVVPFQDVSIEATRRRFEETVSNIEAFKQIYMPHYLDAPSPKFHADLDAMMQYPEKALFPVHGPREHAKSVQCRLNIMEGVLNGRLQYWVFGSEKVSQAYQHIDAIFVELAENPLVKADYKVKILKNDSNEGKFRGRVTCKATGKQNNFMLQAVSDGTSGKGLLFLQYRPQGALVDDIEKLQDQYNPVNGRRKNNWVRQELAGAVTGPVVWVGNMGLKTSALHQCFEEIYDNEEQFKSFKHDGSTPGMFAATCKRNGGRLPSKSRTSNSKRIHL